MCFVVNQQVVVGGWQKFGDQIQQGVFFGVVGIEYCDVFFVCDVEGEVYWQMLVQSGYIIEFQYYVLEVF